MDVDLSDMERLHAGPSFAHHAVKRNHTIVDGLHLEFSVLI